MKSDLNIAPAFTSRCKEQYHNLMQAVKMYALIPGDRKLLDNILFISGDLDRVDLPIYDAFLVWIRTFVASSVYGTFRCLLAECVPRYFPVDACLSIG